MLTDELAEVRGLVAEDVVVVDVIKDPELVIQHDGVARHGC